MPTLIQSSTRIPAAGNMPKTIDEFIGRVNSHTQAASIARMKSPQGWTEPGQKPDFDEYTLVLSGMLRVTSKTDTIDVHAGQAVIAHRGEWVQYSSPEAQGAEYIAVCVPAFTLDAAHRDAT